MSLVLNVEILGEFKKLTSATQGAQGDLTGMGKKAQSISKSIGKAFAAIGIGLSFKVIANELKEATKAAIEDRKSQELLALAMRNTAGATEDQIAAAELNISKMQITTATADDKLRPAYQKMFLATKDVTKANDLLAIALDVSAGTGKDLDTVAQAMAKSLAGNDTALSRLIPSVRDSKDPINDLATAFGGAAKAAADRDPYEKMQIIFGEIQEKLGTALLPILDDFAEWMSSPPGQKTLKEISDAAHDILVELAAVAKWAMANKDWLLPLIAGAGVFSTTVKAIGTITTAIEGITTAIGIMKVAAGSSLLAGLGASATVVGVGAAGSAYGGYLNQKALTEQNKILFAGGTREDPFAGLGKIGDGVYVPPNSRNVNITVNTPKITAKQITDLVNNAQKNGYTGQITIPRR
jgi:hypothetical protein